MSDDAETAAPAAPFGWTAKSPAGIVSLFRGAVPPGYTDQVELATLQDYLQAEHDQRYPALTLDETKAAKLADLSAACASVITGGFTSSALGSPHAYPSGLTDQQNMIASVTASLLPNLPADWTTPFWCADASGAWAFTPHTAAQIQQAGQEGKAFVLAAQAKLEGYRQQIGAATSIDAVNAIAWT